MKPARGSDEVVGVIPQRSHFQSSRDLAYGLDKSSEKNRLITDGYQPNCLHLYFQMHLYFEVASLQHDRIDINHARTWPKQLAATAIESGAHVEAEPQSPVATRVLKSLVTKGTVTQR